MPDAFKPPDRQSLFGKPASTHANLLKSTLLKFGTGPIGWEFPLAAVENHEIS
jgi:hypothetical protein